MCNLRHNRENSVWVCHILFKLSELGTEVAKCVGVQEEGLNLAKLPSHHCSRDASSLGEERSTFLCHFHLSTTEVKVTRRWQGENLDNLTVLASAAFAGCSEFKLNAVFISSRASVKRYSSRQANNNGNINKAFYPDMF